MNAQIDIQVAIEVLYNEIEQLKNQIISESCLTNQEDEQLEDLITKSIKYGELVNKRDQAGSGVILRASDIDKAIATGPDAVTKVIHHVEFVFISKSLELTRGNMTKAAELVGWNRGTFLKRRRRYYKKEESNV